MSSNGDDDFDGLIKLLTALGIIGGAMLVGGSMLNGLHRGWQKAKIRHRINQLSDDEVEQLKSEIIDLLESGQMSDEQERNIEVLASMLGIDPDEYLDNDEGDDGADEDEDDGLVVCPCCKARVKHHYTCGWCGNAYCKECIKDSREVGGFCSDSCAGAYWAWDYEQQD